MFDIYNIIHECMICIGMLCMKLINFDVLFLDNTEKYIVEN